MSPTSRTLAAALTLSLGLLAAPNFAADVPAGDKPKPAPRAADPAAATADKLYTRVSPSFVAVKYTWDFELRRQELIGPGLVVSADGLVMCPLGVFNTVIPDAQMKDFKIIVPSQEKDADEVEAEFVGRDERTNVAFLRPAPAGKKKADPKKDEDKKADAKADDAKDEKKSDDKKPEGKKDADKKDESSAKAEPKPDADKAKAADDKAETKKPEPDAKKPEADAKKPDADDAKPPVPRTWVPVKFAEASFKVGQRIWSIGVLPEAASYKTYLAEARVAATLRGEYPQVLATSGLTGVGSVVFDDAGKAVGFINAQQGQNVFLNDGPNSMAAVNAPPRIFTPAADFLPSLSDPPEAGKPQDLPWVGIPSNAMTGLTKDLSEVYKLTDQPAVQVGDVIPDSPSAKAGLKRGDVIVKLNGQPLERGDETEEIPIIMRRKLVRMKPGTEVTLSVVRKPGQPAQDIKVTLEPAPKMPNVAKRFYAEDLGFGVREMMFTDTYARHLPADAKGVVVSLIKPQSSAQTGGLQGNSSPRSDVVTSINGQPVTDLASFEKLYQAARKDKPKEALVLVVRREGQDNTVRIEPPQ